MPVNDGNPGYLGTDACGGVMDAPCLVGSENFARLCFDFLFLGSICNIGDNVVNDIEGCYTRVSGS